jgi:hypothetical protein
VTSATTTITATTSVPKTTTVKKTATAVKMKETATIPLATPPSSHAGGLAA